MDQLDHCQDFGHGTLDVYVSLLGYGCVWHFQYTYSCLYRLQLNTFVLDWVKLKCCMRAVKGGGPGGPLPYRIYVDSGYVLLCLFALAPAAPLVAPCAFLYFLFSTPMLRRNVIFMYRPK